MTYSTGGIIQTTDFNSIVGNYSNTSYYPDAVTATNKLGAIYGFGYGDRGYGQTANTLTPASTSTLDSADQWSTLCTVLSTVASHQNISLSGLPAPTSFVKGAKISALSFNWASAVATLDTNRFTVNPSQLTTTTVLSDTRSADWSTFIYSEVLVDFGSEDNARFYFNSGGNLQLEPLFTATSSGDPHSQSWNTLTNAVGKIKISTHSTSQTGSGGTAQSIGYYELTSNYQTIFTQYSATSGYTMNCITVNAKFDTIGSPKGNNGGNGRGIRLQIYYNDNYSTSPDLIEGIATVNYYTQIPGSPFIITSPSILLQSSLTGGGGPTYFLFNDTISTTVYNYNLLTQATGAGYAGGNVPIHANITVTGNGQIGSQSTGVPAFTVPSLPVGSLVSLNIQNGGIIAGAGGNGGPGNTSSGNASVMSGTNGGNAISLSYPITLTNYGTIGGGGGGGGGSSSVLDTGCSFYHFFEGPGGNGGGGAGLVSGLGNTSSGLNSNYYGQNGSTLTGGYGGGYSTRTSDNHATFSGVGPAGYLDGFVGGNGGNLGYAGETGYGDYAHGTGGAPGLAVISYRNILPGSNWGNVQGNSDFYPYVSSIGGSTQWDFSNGSPGNITTVYNFSCSDTSFTPIIWFSGQTSSNGISVSISASGNTASATFSSSSTSIQDITGTFVIYAKASNGVVGYIIVNVTQSYIETYTAPGPCCTNNCGGITPSNGGD